MKALVLDDDPVILVLIQTTLEQTGFEIFPFTRGKDALRSLETESFDLIISDLMMPEIGGEEFFHLARKSQPRTPFIFLTANDDVDTAVEIMKLGADDYLQKPVKGKELLARVERVLKENRKEQLIRKTLSDNRQEELEHQGIFSWKKLYRTKDSEQTNRIMRFLSRNIEQGGGFTWLDILKSEIQEKEGDEYPLSRSLMDMVVGSAENIRKVLADLFFVTSLIDQPLDLETVELEDLLIEYFQYYQQEQIPLVISHGKKISLTPLTGPRNYDLNINRDMLFRIFRELLSNAIKYSPEQSKILVVFNVRDTEKGKNLEISFWNPPRETSSRDSRGKVITGIPYEHSESAFELFHTFENFPVQIPEEEWRHGTGLYIVRQLVLKMEGQVEARNIVMHTLDQKTPYVSVTVSLPLKEK
jgi:DNA-binding response OmpR family regulator/two-component sensor histidine kinase